MEEKKNGKGRVMLARGAACELCRMRKVKCDGSKPACGQCRKTASLRGMSAEDAIKMCVYDTEKARRKKGEPRAARPKKPAVASMAIPRDNEDAENSDVGLGDLVAAAVAAANNVSTDSEAPSTYFEGNKSLDDSLLLRGNDAESMFPPLARPIPRIDTRTGSDQYDGDDDEDKNDEDEDDDDDPDDNDDDKSNTSRRKQGKTERPSHRRKLMNEFLDEYVAAGSRSPYSRLYTSSSPNPQLAALRRSGTAAMWGRALSSPVDDPGRLSPLPRKRPFDLFDDRPHSPRRRSTLASGALSDSGADPGSRYMPDFRTQEIRATGLSPRLSPQLLSGAISPRMRRRQESLSPLGAKRSASASPPNVSASNPPPGLDKIALAQRLNRLSNNEGTPDNKEEMDELLFDRASNLERIMNDEDLYYYNQEGSGASNTANQPNGAGPAVFTSPSWASESSVRMTQAQSDEESGNNASSYLTNWSDFVNSDVASSPHSPHFGAGSRRGSSHGLPFRAGGPSLSRRPSSGHGASPGALSQNGYPNQFSTPVPQKQQRSFGRHGSSGLSKLVSVGAGIGNDDDSSENSNEHVDGHVDDLSEVLGAHGDPASHNMQHHGRLSTSNLPPLALAPDDPLLRSLFLPLDAESSPPMLNEDPVAEPSSHGEWTIQHVVWPAGLPPFKVTMEFVHAFFTRAKSVSNFIDHPRLLLSLTLPSTHPQFPEPALLHAICAYGLLLKYKRTATSHGQESAGTSKTSSNPGEAMSANGNEGRVASDEVNHCEEANPLSSEKLNDSILFPSDIEKGHLSPASRALFGHYMEALSLCRERFMIAKDANHLQLLQALILLTNVILFSGRYTDLWLSSSLMTRACFPLGLTSMPHKNLFVFTNRMKTTLLDVPSTEQEYEEQLHTFWEVVSLDRLVSTIMSWAPAIPDTSITSPFPHEEFPLRSTSSVTPYIQLQHDDFFMANDGLCPYSLFLKAVVLLGRASQCVSAFNQKKVVNLSNNDSNSNARFLETPEFQAVNADVKAFRQYVSRHFFADTNDVIRGHEVLAFLIPHAATIILYERAVVPENCGLPNSPQSRCLMSAQSILSATLYMFDLVLDVADTLPHLLLCWKIAGLTLIREIAVRERTGEIQTVLKARQDAFICISFLQRFRCAGIISNADIIELENLLSQPHVLMERLAY